MCSQATDAASPDASEQLWELQRRCAAEHRFGDPEQGRCTALFPAAANLRWGKSRVCCLVQSPALRSFPSAHAALCGVVSTTVAQETLIFSQYLSFTQAAYCPETRGAGRSKHGTAARSETRVLCWEGRQRVAIHSCPRHPDLGCTLLLLDLGVQVAGTHTAGSSRKT